MGYRGGMSEIVSTNIEGVSAVGVRDRAALVKFLHEYARSGHIGAAAWAAQVSESTAKGWIQRPDVITLLHAARERLLQTEGASVGLRVLLELAEGPSVPAAVRRAAAKDLLALGGHSEVVAAQKSLAGQAPKSLQDMAPDELERTIAAASATLAQLRRPVINADAAPVTPRTPDPASLL